MPPAPTTAVVPQAATSDPLAPAPTVPPASAPTLPPAAGAPTAATAGHGPTHSSPIAVTSDDATLLVVNPLNNSISIVNVQGDAN